MPDFSPLRRLALGLSVVMLAACASRPPVQQDIPPRPSRASIQAFAMTARVVIQQNQRADTMRLAWEHSPQHDAIGFENSLGMIVAELQRDALGARWLTAAGERYEARSADDLMARLTNRPVPVQALSLWVTGRLGRNGVGRNDAQGRLVEGQDAGWVVRVLEYETGLPEAMPRIVEVETSGLRIRLAIDAWLL